MAYSPQPFQVIDEANRALKGKAKGRRKILGHTNGDKSARDMSELSNCCMVVQCKPAAFDVRKWRERRSLKPNDWTASAVNNNDISRIFWSSQRALILNEDASL
ncbi:uncharacterized protein PAC_12735 [Phialocephala subalpina]|uniref:Uncharacterized protein n=1 Tax=Phialocephala subalpina TaxID=576137 RepID=A0A1L7XCU5_9HELO|nr:uncharacterized protein PAC_12735 [Phialocephala subalpina]